MADSGTFILRDAECSDLENETECENENSADSDISDLVDDTEVCQGNILQLVQEQQRLEDDRTVAALKRKYIRSPKEKIDTDLSPTLRAIHISPEKQAPKRRLFWTANDSGLELDSQYEAERISEEGTSQVTVNAQAGNATPPLGGGREKAATQLAEELLKSSNRRATQNARFKEHVGVSFSEITRDFKNDQTCAGHWVAAVYDALECFYDASITLLKTHCLYYNVSRHVGDKGSVSLYLLSFKVNKSRLTVCNLLKSMLQVEDYQILSNPPRLRSSLTALFWFRLGFSSLSQTYGEAPEWIKRQTMVSHQTAAETTFSLAEMVQWAYDNNINDECTLAYEYALCAEENSNANAWLSSNCQAKYVKECMTMLRYYKNAEMQRMSMASWVHARCRQYANSGDWKVICSFLKYQHVEIPVFWQTLKDFLHKVPKRSCIVIYGPSNTGKSMFSLSLIRFLGGAVLSFHNYKSHFWLSPLTHTKVALIDDATEGCWDYLDKYLRNGLDGNELSIDVKHKQPLQLRCPPILITSNIDITTEKKWAYLTSRVTMICFKNKMPLDEKGMPLYMLEPLNWKFLFKRLWRHLEFSDQEDEGNGDTSSSFKCTARTSTGAI